MNQPGKQIQQTYIPAPHEIAGVSEAKWIVIVMTLMLILALALVFALFAWNDAQPNRPYANLNRNNVNVHGRLTVRDTADFDNSVNASHISYDSISYRQLQVLTQTGPFSLSPYKSNYRIDTSGENTIQLLLPYASQAPGHIYNIFLSEMGAENKVEFIIKGGDQACDEDGCSTTNPAYVMPSTEGSPDFVQVLNDSHNAWHFVAHTKT